MLEFWGATRSHDRLIRFFRPPHEPDYPWLPLIDIYQFTASVYLIPTIRTVPESPGLKYGEIGGDAFACIPALDALHDISDAVSRGTIPDWAAVQLASSISDMMTEYAQTTHSNLTDFHDQACRRSFIRMGRQDWAEEYDRRRAARDEIVTLYYGEVLGRSILERMAA